MRIAVLAAALAAALGCGSGTPVEPTPLPPPSEPAELVLQPANPVITDLQDSVVVTATAADTAVQGLRLDLVSETRELAELPVLAGQPLKRAVLIPTGPGTVTLTASAAGARSATITVRVAPDRPAIYTALLAPGGAAPDTVVLRGTRLQELATTAVRLDGDPVTFVSAEPTTMRLLPTPAADTGCSGTAPVAVVTADGATLVRGLGVPRPRAGETRLAVGAWRLLTGAEAACIRLPAGGGAYVLAYADLRQVEQARTGWAGPLPDDFTVIVTDRTAGAVAGAAPAGGLSAARTGPGRDAAAAQAEPGCSDDDFTNLFFSFWCRSAPWQVGDRFRLLRPGGPDTVMAEVYGLADGGRFVFAAIDGDNSSALAALRGAIDAAMPIVLEHAIPLLRTALGDTYPRTSSGTNQLLAIIGDFTHGSMAGGCCYPDVGPYSVMLLGSTLSGSLSQIVYLLSHELAHGWQRQAFFDDRPAGADPVTGPAYWGLEGGADLLALEAVRRWAGIPWRANLAHGPLSDPGNAAYPLRVEVRAAGLISLGYHHASSFLRDVVARMVAQGAPLDDAFRAAARGSIEDWYGHDFDGVWRGGLAARVRPMLGEAWEPGEALLLYTLAQGADDLTTSPDLQNPFYAAVWDVPPGAGFGRPTVGPATPTRMHSRVLPATSTGLVILENGGSGSTFAAESTRPATNWAVARIR